MPSDPPVASEFSLSVIDLSPTSSPEAEQELADRLVSTMHSLGFIYIKNHGLEPRTEWAFNLAKEFSNTVPDEEKIKYKMGANYIGYSAVGGQTLDPSGIPDKKEMYNLHKWGDQHPGYSSQPHPEFFKERWTELEDFSRQCQGVAMKLLRLVSLGLQIPAPGNTVGAGPPYDGDYLPKLHPYDGPSGDTLRFLKYPKPRADWSEAESSVRIGAHTDFGSVSLVFSDDTGGLQLLDPATGSWKDVPPIPGAIVVNIGDILSFWSGSFLRSTLHRVVPAVGKNQDRFAVAYFCRPAFDTRLTPIPSPFLGKAVLETTDGEAPKDRDVTAGEWLKARVAKSIGNSMPSGY